MSADYDPNNLPEQVDRVTAWRQEVLECAGFTPCDALRLATDRTVDLHRAVDLVRSGCSTFMAVKILG